MSDKELADKIGVSPAAFSSWRRHSVPKESQIAKLAYELAERDLVKAHRIEQDLLEALKGSDQAADGMTPPLIRAQRGETIKLGVVKYSAFSKFFSSVGDTLLRDAATTSDPRADINLATVIDD